MRKLLVLAGLLGCSSKPPAAHDAMRPAAPAAVAVDAGAGVVAAPVPDPATAITPVELAGPFPSLADGCKAARPCGFTDMDPTTGTETKPATKPRCDAVLDPTIDIIGNVPSSISTTGGSPKMTHKVGDAEIRLGGVICSVPQGLRRDHSEYYVFVHRADGWWRTSTPMFEYEYNNKYCGGGLYVMWNDKPTRTIAGIAAEAACLTCTKQASAESTVELMLRVETTGAKPAVFPFLPVGHRRRVEMFDASPGTPSECKPSKSAMSLKETWPADNEVILDGAAGPPVVTDGLTIHALVGDGSIKPGHFRFTR